MVDQEIEASVIGGLLLGGYTPDASDVLSSMSGEEFSIGLYRKAFLEIKRQAKTRSLIDALMIAEAMGQDNFSSIMETARRCPSAANLKGYARVVGDYAKIRNFTALLETGREAILSSGSHDLAMEAMAMFISTLSAIDTPTGELQPIHISELLDAYANQLEQRLKFGEQSDTLKTGIPELDEITGGINSVDLVIVAARPGMGKTEFALKVVNGIAEQMIPGSEEKRGVLVFSMEMDAGQIIERQLADASQLPVSLLRNPSRMRDEGWARVSQGIGRLTGLNVWVIDASKLNVEQIAAIATRHKRTHQSLSLIMVDYLGLIEKPKADRNDLAIAHISGGLKRLAKDLKTPVMSLSQLSRDVEKRPNKRPLNADLRDSGSVEQDADSIIMLYREAVYKEDSPAAPFAEIIVTKNRFGKLGTVYQEFKNGHFMPTNQEQAANSCRQKNIAEQPRRFARGANV